MNPDVHFVHAMGVIVCTVGVGKDLRTSVCTSSTVLEADGRIKFKIVQETLNAVKYRDGILDHIVLPYCNSHVTSMQDVTWLVFVKTF